MSVGPLRLVVQPLQCDMRSALRIIFGGMASTCEKVDELFPHISTSTEIGSEVGKAHMS